MGMSHSILSSIDNSFLLQLCFDLTGSSAIPLHVDIVDVLLREHLGYLEERTLHFASRVVVPFGFRHLELLHGCGDGVLEMANTVASPMQLRFGYSTFDQRYCC